MKGVHLALLLVMMPVVALQAGTLEIQSQPQVEVYWEGVLLDTTDADGVLVVEDVPTGPFELELRKAGYAAVSTRVEIGSGTTRLSRPLEEIPSAEPVSAAESEGAAESAPPAAVTPSPSPEMPGVRVSSGALAGSAALLALMAGLAYLYARSRQRTSVADEAPPFVERRGAPRPQATRTAGPGGAFLSELRQRERALDGGEEPANREAPVEELETDIVDVAWREVD